MNTYEIRILDADNRPSAIIEATYMSDYSAIRSARKLAADRVVEVWRDLECIYQEFAASSGYQGRAA